MDPQTLHTPRLELRAPVGADIDAVHAACQDPEIQRWVPLPSPYERGHAEYFVEHIVPEGWRTDTTYTFCTFPRGGGPLVGAANIHHRQGDTWEVGFWTVREHRGRGYTAEAVTALARWAFGRGVERVEWRAEAGNAASRRVAERAGFVVEGTLRAALLSRDVLRDLWIGSLLPSDVGLEAGHAYLPGSRSHA
ncbi:GNAT family N-acetyltransferase [Streptomyces fuscigenes]|uniref:GNAT family N-acetyltransferase n=1 Tax=Streptomyces fuscigenes TaxID=1528880 RepID=UPI001F380117|nr:GNAT family protein [Streptomyces fuscigenes]MCF3961663.1 GNAT family N-acetyltransferase [Streptomyces fuscigenes]